MMNEKMKKQEKNILGLDWGRERIGVAYSLGGLRVVLEGGSVKNDEGVWKELGKICQEKGVERVVVGYPRELGGEEKESAREAKEFGKEVGERLGVEVEFFDERFTTTIAERMLVGRRASEKKERVDGLAAGEMLKGWWKRREN